MEKSEFISALRGSSQDIEKALQIAYRTDFELNQAALQQVDSLRNDPDYGVRFWSRKVFSKYTAAKAPKTAERVAIQPLNDLPVELLIKKLWDVPSTFVSMEVIKRLCEIKDRKGLFALIDYAKQCPDAVQVSYITKQIGLHFPTDEVLNLLLPFLQHSDERVIANTLEGIEAINSPTSVVVFTRFLEHANNRIRSNAAKALAKFDFQLTYDALLHMMWVSEEPHLAISACYAIRQLQDARFLPLLAQLLRNDMTIADCLKTVEVIPGKKSIEMLQEALKDCADEERACLIQEVITRMSSAAARIDEHGVAQMAKVVQLKRVS